MLSQVRTATMLNILKHPKNRSFNDKIRLLTQRILANDSNIKARSCASTSSEIVEKTNAGEINIKSEETFASLLRHSAFMQIGNPIGKVN